MITTTNLTVDEFWALPEGETNYELVDGIAIAKVSPKSFHSFLQFALCTLIKTWCKGKGRVGPEWAVALSRNGIDWIPTPDVTYVSYNLLPKNWKVNAACPVPCDLAIEIISPGQTMSEFERSVGGGILPRQTSLEKARDYLSAGVALVWVIDPNVVSITAFSSDGTRTLYTGTTKIIDSLLPGLELSTQLIIDEAELL